MKLPPEVFAMVCKHSRKRDLKSIRQVSKACDQAAVTYLFDEIFMSFNTAELRIAQQVIFKFKHCIHTLIFSSVCYHHIDPDDFGETWDLAFPDDEDSEAHSNYAYEQYSLAVKAQKDTIRTGACPVYLSFALSNIPRLQKIILTDLTSTRSMSHESMQEYGPGLLRKCPLESCEIMTCEDHYTFDPPAQPGFNRSDVFNPLRTILLALAVTVTTVPELTMETSTHESCAIHLNTSALRMSQPDLRAAIVVFATLTKLRLCLDVNEEKFCKDNKTYYVSRNVPKLLNAAVNLEYFTLEAFDAGNDMIDSKTSFEVLLGQCIFPKLKSLILVFLWSSEMELLHFLQHCTQLEQMTLHCHHLTSGSWAAVANRMKLTLPLKSIAMGQLYGDFPGDTGVWEYQDWGDIGNFFFGKGGNPFTEEGLKRWLADRAAGKKPLKSGAEPEDPVERYYYFHE